MQPLMNAVTKLEGDGIVSSVFDIWTRLEKIYNPNGKSTIPSEL
jgi:hypothetical protein